MGKEISKNKYCFPVDFKFVTGVFTHESPAHVGPFKHSIDYTVPEGTAVKAAAEGTILAVRDNSKEGGRSKKFDAKTNFILVKHKNNEVTVYEHLRYRGAKVKVGDVVGCRQIIGYSGNTGWSYGPHLHFMACKLVRKGKRFNNEYGGYFVSSVIPMFKWPPY